MDRHSTYEVLRAFSEKDFDVTKSIEPRKFSKKVSSLTEGTIRTTSGYLEVCEACNVDAYGEACHADAYGEKSKINLNSPKWTIP